MPTLHKLCSRVSPGSKNLCVLGPALETLSKLAAAQESFDFVFIDADKQEYVQYPSVARPAFCLPLSLTIHCFQQPYLPQSERTRNGEAIAEFNRIVKMTQELNKCCCLCATD